MSELVLKINKVAYTGFESVHIRKSMLDMCGAFIVSTDNFFQGGTSSQEIKMGQGVKVEINGFPVIDGYIDEMPIDFGRNRDHLEISGRDNTMDLVDCSWNESPNEWKNQTVKNLIKTFCTKFGITVVVDDSASSEVETKIESYKANEGMPISELISELCRDIGILTISKGDGYLTLTKATIDEYTTDPLIVGGNAEGGRLLQSNRNRYSSYKIKGYGIGTDNKALADFVDCSGDFSDSIINRDRPFVGFAENATTSAICFKKAIWQARINAGLSRGIIYNVDSWIQSDDKPWQINKLVKIKDDFTGIDDTRLIAAIDYIYDEDDGGDISKIMVVDKNTFSLSEDQINIKTRFDI